MAIYRINQGLSLQEQVRQLNEMILELNGRVSKGEFNKNELDSIFTNNSISDRQYLRNVGLGNSDSTYDDWTHVWAEAGYSIWKCPVTNYSHSSLNELYFNNKLYENRGQATSEAITAFDSVQFMNGDSGSTYTNDTTEAASEGGTEFALMSSSSDALYIGHSSKFFGFKVELATQGRGYNLAYEYWNGSAWADLDASTLTVTDSTSDFASDGRINWEDPGNWATTTVNGVASKYWVRITTTDEPTTVAEAYLIIPDASVIGLLGMSSSEILAEEWAWCYFSNYVYVTIRNAGNSAYEGTYHVKSSSSNANKANYFAFNNGDGFEINYKDSTYSP